MPVAKKKRIGDMLVETNLITEDQLQSALEEQKLSNSRLGDILISKRYVTEEQIIEVLEMQLGIPHVQLHAQQIDPKAIAVVPQKLAERYKVLPLRIDGNTLLVAMYDPMDYFAIDDLRMSTGMHIDPVIASKEELGRAIPRYYGTQDSVNQFVRNMGERELTDAAVFNEDAFSPVIKTVNQIIEQAVQLRASDIHFDPQEDGLHVRYRVDGILRTEKVLPHNMQNVISARIKIMSQLDVAERRLPLDGRVEMQIDKRKIDFRISTLPTIYGEKVVMRILDSHNKVNRIEQLGFTEHNVRRFRSSIENAYGMVVLAGPTGSGKTTTLYAALTHLSDEHVNVITIEDPVEYHLPGINQVQVNSATGLTFAKGLRAVLRQDPNIVMIGEMRDVETAEIAVRAAMTGHMVLSTLHANSSVNALTRLIDMGVEPFLVATSLSCIVAQRLVRCVCPVCAKEYEPQPQEKELLEEYGVATDNLRKGMGCLHCSHTGYKGRMAIHEVLVLDDTLRSMVLLKRADSEYREYAEKQGLNTMLYDGLHKVGDGLTTVQEVLRVTDRV
ncbi:GspE/PulE family protein [Paenibacillus sp. SI8]|uniref:GspE/PulE family protein n=1 Tax=unclassified Paenibacillus TaxID=185978 RepID=UPI0034668EA0